MGGIITFRARAWGIFLAACCIGIGLPVHADPSIGLVQDLRLTTQVQVNPDLPADSGTFITAAPSWAWNPPATAANVTVVAYNVYLDDIPTPLQVTNASFTYPRGTYGGDTGENGDGGIHCIQVQAVASTGQDGGTSPLSCAPNFDIWPPLLIEKIVPAPGHFYASGSDIAITNGNPASPALVIGAFDSDIMASSEATPLWRFGLFEGNSTVGTSYQGPACNESASDYPAYDFCWYMDDSAPPGTSGIVNHRIHVVATDAAYNQNETNFTYTKARAAVVEAPCAPNAATFCNTVYFDHYRSPYDLIYYRGSIDRRPTEAAAVLYKRVHGGLGVWTPLSPIFALDHFTDPTPTTLGTTYDYAWGFPTARGPVAVSNVASITAAHNGTRLGSIQPACPLLPPVAAMLAAS
ncbi:MAG: hypothetical protein ACYDDF_09785 [Thermoplasmatota archaeon]